MSKGHKVITLSSEVYDALDAMRQERKRELGISLSWNDFVKLLAEKASVVFVGNVHEGRGKAKARGRRVPSRHKAE